LSFTGQWLASTVCAPAMRKARRKDITPSPIFTSPVPLSQALRMTNSVPCKFNSDASRPVSKPSSSADCGVWNADSGAWLAPASAMPQRTSGFSQSFFGKDAFHRVPLFALHTCPTAWV
jgi:hypothetical protein